MTRSDIVNLSTRSVGWVEAIRSQCLDQGFCLFRPTGDIATDAAIPLVARELNLGVPYIPTAYDSDRATFGYNDDGYNHITPNLAKSHGVFGEVSKQGFHTDGTLETIGSIPTSILLFERCAAAGGETTIFLAVEAYKSLSKVAPRAVETLCDEDALLRTARSIQPPSAASGPAFKHLNDRIITRWTDDGSETWDFSGDRGELRRRVVRDLRSMSYPGTQFYLEFVVSSGIGIVICNDTIAHGRKSFSNSPGAERSVIRGLFLRSIHE